MAKSTNIYEQDGKIKKNKILSCLLVIILTPLITGLSAFLYMGSMESILQLSLFGFITASIIIFIFTQAEINHELNYDNNIHPLRFTIIYIIGVCLSCVYPLLPNTCWPFLFIILALGFFSNTLIGICSGTFLLSFSILLGKENIYVFLLYFLSALIACMVFHKLSDDFAVILPIFISMMIFLCFHVIFGIITVETIGFTTFAMPIMNIFINIILLIFVLRLYSNRVVNRYAMKYQEINDPEFVILAQLKKDNKEEYYKVIHTAYFSEKIARELKADPQLTRALAYYHRMGKYYESKVTVKHDAADIPVTHHETKSSEEYIYKISAENKFPPALYKLLLEYNNDKKQLKSREAMIVLLSDAVVTSVLYLFAKDPNGIYDYEQIVELVFKKKIESKAFIESEITLYELNKMKKIFAGEKLYYDFLR